MLFDLFNLRVMFTYVKKELTAKVTLLLFILFSFWWIWLHLTDATLIQKQAFSAFYGLIALFGSICGFSIARKWGGFKSLMGKSIIMFSMGLLAQEFGQIVYSALNFFLQIVVPYPSLGDIGYFGSIPLYILGAYYLARVSGVNISLRTLRSKILVLIVPLLLLTISYFLFLQGYELEETPIITIFLDFGYPFGQAIYVSIALLAFLLSKKILGGIMKNKILFILFALLVQYFSDFSFLYISRYGEMGPGEIVDYMYLVSYFLMSLGLIQLKTVSNELNGH
ncbi:MAG: Membrane protein [Candidatus Woesebacteria bacterium GW2011_GWB1_39_12]|uniref:Membrane protein n=2 Tax=Candidatus Woeseibacteriota TaxID=1752722 RepID=A0A0G0M2I8_9BACT|nr:MAG: Membrane protein [Candidatus Woesebacteria bacterium GW2011_GWA1_39_12]KKR01468.1 MAG: Membrane protein [Candidatus Woesebacteria bacterium GW2011_GWB1_39_12]